MDVLAYHKTCPGQFGGICTELVQRGHTVKFIAETITEPIPGVDIHHQAEMPHAAAHGIHPWLGTLNEQTWDAQATAITAAQLASTGFDPGLVFGHPGWGQGTFLRTVYPKAVHAAFAELWRNNEATGVDGPISLPQRASQELTNLSQLLPLTTADRVWSPTDWQESTYPDSIRDRITVMHEGIETAPFDETPPEPVRLGGTTITPDDTVVTYAARVLEPWRGFDTFVAALDRITVEQPDAHVVIVGSPEPGGYGPPHPSGRPWAEIILDGRDFDPGRVHLVGWVPHRTLRAILAISTAHVYLTHPFVASWSLIEAMAAGALVIGSNTSPVRELITDRETGILVDYPNAEALAVTVSEAIETGQGNDMIRSNAARIARTRFDRRTCSARIADWLCRDC